MQKVDARFVATCHVPIVNDQQRVEVGDYALCYADLQSADKGFKKIINNNELKGYSC